MYELEKNRLVEKLLLMGQDFDKVLEAVNKYSDPVYVYNELGIPLPEEYRINQNIDIKVPSVVQNLPQIAVPEISKKSTEIVKEKTPESKIKNIVPQPFIDSKEIIPKAAKLIEKSSSDQRDREGEIKINKHFKISKKKPKELFLGLENKEKRYEFTYEGPVSSEFTSFNLISQNFSFDNPSSIPKLAKLSSKPRLSEGLSLLQSFSDSLLIKETNSVHLPKMLEYCIEYYSSS